MVCRLRQCLVFFGCVTIAFAFASVGEAQTRGKHVGFYSTPTNAYGLFDYTNPKLQAEKLHDTNFTLRCNFECAQCFAPNDPVFSIVEGVHYFALEDLSAAEKALLRASEISAQSQEAAYNLGPLYIRKGDFDQAGKYPAVSYGNGYPLP